MLLLLFCVFGLSEGLENGLARTPPMGWMQWERFRCITDCEAYPDECISEGLFKTQASLLASDGYLDAGYNYIMIDDCWTEKTRDENGRLQPNAQRFPNGIQDLSDYIHSKGLRFGIYADFGNYTCAGYPGSLDYLEVDAQTFADWEVDYLKLDACYSDEEELENGYREMGRYLNETGRPIVFSCSWPAYQEPLNISSNYSALAETCNLWRNWDDIDDSRESFLHIYQWFRDNQNRIAPFAGPGHWNDPDMLNIGNYGLSYEQAKAQMTIWSIMAAPLIMSVDLRTIEPKFRDILLNRDAIRISQDPLGIQGLYVMNKTKIDFWTRPILPTVNEEYTYAVGLYSLREDGYPYRVNFTLADLKIEGTSGYELKDVFDPTSDNNGKVVQSNDLIFARVKPTGAVLLIATPLSGSSTTNVELV